MRKIHLSLLLGLVTISAIGCGHSAASDYKTALEKIASIEKVAVKTATVQRGTITAAAKAIGTLTPVHTTSAAAEVEGKIVSYLPSLHTVTTQVNGAPVTRIIGIDIGCDVKEGDVLFEIDPVNYKLAVEQAEAALQLTKAQKEEYLIRGRRPEEIAQLYAIAQKMLSEAKKTQAEYERFRPLMEKGAVTRSEFEKVETDWLVSQAELSAAQSAYDLAMKGPNEPQIAVYDAQINAAEAQLNIAREKLAKTKVHANYNATITKRFKDIGDYVSVGNPVISYIDSNLLFADVSVPESVAHYIRRTDGSLPNVKVYVSGVAEPVLGSIDLINQIIDADSFSKRLRITIDNHDHRLTPGGFVRAEIPISSNQATLIVPRSAVILVDGNNIAYVISGGKAAQRQLQIGLVSDEQIEVIEGLTEGEKVACERLAILADQMEVAE
ncbi:MAG: efflux RND transporter periplasmic adaptor subunit [Thermoguttaceae bacterium]